MSLVVKIVITMSQPCQWVVITLLEVTVETLNSGHAHLEPMVTHDFVHCREVVLFQRLFP
jgi:hypothetical protein